MSKNHTESKTLPPLLISKSLKPTGVKQLEPISSSTPSDIPNRPMGRDQSIHSEANKGGEAGDVAAMEEVMHQQHLDDMQRVRQQFAQKLLDVEREENALVEVEAKRIQTQHRLKLTSLHESCVEEFQKLSVSLKLEYAIKTQQEQQLLERQLHEQRERGKGFQHDQKRGEEESSLHHRRIDTLTSAHQVELDGLSLHHLNVVDKMKVGQAEELKQLQLQHDKAQTDLDAQHLHATTDNRDEHQKTLQNLLSIQHVESEHFKREVESTKAKRIDQLHHQLDSEILKLESEMTDALASKRSKLHEEFKPMLDGERKEFEREIEAKRMGWKKELKHLQEQIDQDFERVRSEGESRLRHFQTQSFSNENDGNAQELHPRHLTHQPSHPPKKVDDKSTSFGENANSTDSPCEDSDVQSLVEEVEDNFHTTLTSSPHRTIQHYLQQESRQIQSVKQLIKEQTRSMHQRHQELNKVRKQWQHQLPPHQFTTSVSADTRPQLHTLPSSHLQPHFPLAEMDLCCNSSFNEETNSVAHIRTVPNILQPEIAVHKRGPLHFNHIASSPLQILNSLDACPVDLRVDAASAIPFRYQHKHPHFKSCAHLSADEILGEHSEWLHKFRQQIGRARR